MMTNSDGTLELGYLSRNEVITPGLSDIGFGVSLPDIDVPDVIKKAGSTAKKFALGDKERMKTEIRELSMQMNKRRDHLKKNLLTRVEQNKMSREKANKVYAKECNRLEKAFNAKVQKIKKDFAGVAGKATNFANDAIANFKKGANKIAQKAKDGANKLIEGAKDGGDMLNDLRKKLNLENITKGLSNVKDKMLDKAKELGKKIKNAAGKTKELLKKKFKQTQEFVKGIGDKIKGLGGKIRNLGSKIANVASKVTGVVKDGINAVKGKVKAMGDKVMDGLSSAKNALMQQGERLASNLTKKMSTMASKFGDKINTLKSAMNSTIKEHSAQLKRTFKKGMNKLQNQLNGVREALSNQMTELKEAVTRKIQAIGEKLGEMQKAQERYFEQLRTGQKTIVDSSKRYMKSQADAIMDKQKFLYGTINKKLNQVDEEIADKFDQANVARETVKNKLTNQMETVKDHVVEEVTNLSKINKIGFSIGLGILTLGAVATLATIII